MTVTQRGAAMTEKSSRRGPIVAGTVLAAVLLGGGAYAAAQWLAPSGGQPDSVLPASSAVYARFDVDPSAGQKVAAVRLLQGLDEETRARLDAGEWREWLWERLVAEGRVPAALDYETDIEPWLGDRAGVAVVPRGGGQEPVVAVALEVKDGQMATDTLDRVTADQADRPAEEQVDYYLDDDYVVVTQAAAMTDLRAAVEQGTLDGHQAYVDDTAELGDAGIASVWADLARSVDLADAVDPAATSGLPDMDPPDGLVTGRVAATLRLTEDAIEVHGVSVGPDGLVLPTGGDSARLVDGLPSDTAIAISLENGAAWVDSAWDHYSTTFPEEAQKAVDEAAAQGFTLPDDLRTVLGDSMVLAAGPGVVEAVEGQTSTMMPQLPIGYRAETDSTAVQELLVDAGVPPMLVPQRVDGGVLTLGLDRSYVDALAASDGTLSDSSSYQAAVADAGDADSVVYIDVNPFEKFYLPEIQDEQIRTSLEALGTVGLSTVVEDESMSRFTLRFVADPE